MSLLLQDSTSATLFPDSNAAPKTHPGADCLSKVTTEKWNQTNLGYFNPHLNRAYGKGEIVLVRKEIYYMNIVLFV